MDLIAEHHQEVPAGRRPRGGADASVRSMDHFLYALKLGSDIITILRHPDSSGERKGFRSPARLFL